MQFQSYDLGHQDRGAVVVVTLRGNAANVRLMDSSNHQAFKRGGRHRYIGGLAKSSPVRLVAKAFFGLPGSDQRQLRDLLARVLSGPPAGGDTRPAWDINGPRRLAMASVSKPTAVSPALGPYQAGAFLSSEIGPVTSPRENPRSPHRAPPGTGRTALPSAY